jgi:hypothetical protein
VKHGGTLSIQIINILVDEQDPPVQRLPKSSGPQFIRRILMVAGFVVTMDVIFLNSIDTSAYHDALIIAPNRMFFLDSPSHYRFWGEINLNQPVRAVV